MAGTDLIKSHSYPQFQNLPSDEVLDKEVFGTKQVQNARKATSQPIYQIKPDQQSTFDDEIDEVQLKKQQKLQKAPISTSIPRLASLDTVFPISKLTEEEIEDEKIEESDSSLDRAFHQGANITRESHYEHANYSMQEIMRRQKLIHDLHEEKGKLLDQLSERMKKSTNLGWVHSLLSLGTAGLTVFGIVFTIATGGLGAPLLAALGVAATAVNGVMGAQNQILDIQSKEQQGDIEVIKQQHEMENKKIEAESHNRQVILSLLHKLVEIELQIAKNRNYTRMN